MVLVEDECRIAQESDTAAIWYEKGKSPAIRVDRKREGRSFYGALDVGTGQCHLQPIVGKQVSERTVEFLESLEPKYAGKRVLLLWDGAPWHRGKVREYLKRTHKKFWIEILYFPPYWPELNPQEHIWKSAKQYACHNSERCFADKINKFAEYIQTTIFPSNFLKKYA